MGEMNFNKVCYLTQYMETLPFQYIINIEIISFHFFKKLKLSKVKNSVFSHISTFQVFSNIGQHNCRPDPRVQELIEVQLKLSLQSKFKVSEQGHSSYF